MLIRELTPREVEVAALIAKGLSNKLIGVTLDISDHTAHFHVGNILRKWNVDNRAQVAAMAVRMGIA